jgi:transcription antitermination factor NusG
MSHAAFEHAVREAKPSPYRLMDGLLEHHPGLTWYVARCATRREAVAERSLTNAHVAFYVPRLTRWTGEGFRRRRVTYSLFEGYFFAGLTPAQSFYELPMLEGVHGVVRFGEGAQPKPVEFGMIALTLAAEQAGHFDRTVQAAREGEFRPGETVKVVDGKFFGFTAQFIRLSPRERVRVMLSLFGRQTEVDLPSGDVRKLA